MNKAVLWAVLTMIIPFSALADDGDLSLSPEDVIIAQGTGNGYDFWIRRKPGTASVLLTESIRDPVSKQTNYALRNPVWHPLNGDEKRMLNGNFIDPALKLYSLIDSTPETHPILGSAFHIFVPYLVIYGGYPGERAGKFEIRDDLFVNIRAFSKAYADYAGFFHDNPFRLAFIQAPLDAPREKALLDDTRRTFREIAEKGGGESYTTVRREEIGEALDAIAADGEGDRLDLALCLDTTDSMANDIEDVKSGLLAVMKKYRSRYRSLRVGTVLYKDYFEEYMIKVSPFSSDTARVERSIAGTSVRGGRDTPEAVYEALAGAIRELDWKADRKIIILVGDAPPHPLPRGKVTKEQVFAEAAAAGIKIHAIILPQ